MKRLVIVYSPRSARYAEVERKVIAEARKLRGWMILKYEVREALISENAAELAKIIRKDDLVLCAGGDGTATMTINAIMLSGKVATMAVMPFGNFNDYVETFGKMSLARIIRRFEEGRFRELYPMEVKVNGRHYIHSGMYFTVGMMAEAAGVMKRPKVRRKIGRVKNRMSFTARKMFSWYLRNKRRKDFLPSGMKINGVDVVKNTTDYVAMNGESMAGVVPARGWTEEPRIFWSGTMRNRSFWRMFIKFVKAVEGGLPGGETEKDVLEFRKPADVYVHTEGEGEQLENVKEIVIKKSGESLRVISA